MRIDELATGAQSWPDAFVSAVLAGTPSNGELPNVLMYYPVAQINPYQPLLYAAAERHGLSVLPVLRRDTVAQIAWRDHAILHLHWLASILQNANSAVEALQAVDQYKQQLALWRARGIRLVWTVHNVMPHRSRWQDAEIAVRQMTADAADLIHVMNGDTLSLTSPYFHIDPNKVAHIPHPSYRDWYANVMSQSQARQDLGLNAEDFVYLCFGSIQPYKGLTQLVEAFDAAHTGNGGKRSVLIIAGQVDDEAYFNELRNMARSRNDVRLFPGNVRDQRIQSFFNACNVVVTPYLATLNSGVALLAATFRRLVVAPATGGMAEVFASDPTLLYNADEPGALSAALERARYHSAADDIFDTILHAHDPDVISTRFCTEMRALLRGATSRSAPC